MFRVLKPRLSKVNTQKAPNLTGDFLYWGYGQTKLHIIMVVTIFINVP